MRITGIVTDHGRMQADAYLVALGSHSPRLLAPLGVRVPIYPVKGYSITHCRSPTPAGRRSRP